MRLLSEFGFSIPGKYYDMDSNSFIEDGYNPNSEGWYKLIDGAVCAVVIIERKLYFIWGDKKYDFSDNYHIKLELGGHQNGRTLNFFQENKLIFQFGYEIEVCFEVASPLFDWWLTDEDYDWGLWVSNIFSNEERQMIVIENNDRRRGRGGTSASF